MVIVIAKLTVKQGKKAELFALAQGVIAATRTEPECISYELLDDPYDTGSCSFVERWTDKAALERHLKTPHISKWRQQSLPLLAAKTIIKLYQSEEIDL
jgi:quinol monooxygenase YgiN